jgi:hypothetical protein
MQLVLMQKLEQQFTIMHCLQLNQYLSLAVMMEQTNINHTLFMVVELV